MGTMRIVGGLKLDKVLPPDVYDSIPEGMLAPQTGVEKAASKGDMPVEWDPTNPTEVRYAREIYNHAVKKKFKPFARSGSGPGKPQTAFDPNAGELIFVAPMAGG